ncbi:hemolysin family protein [Nonlabens ulvanivorans]|uniref:Hemolysin n=3 Tax=Nonlabens ulvanivorans TaxID=906888 RepID=A0A084JST1_NONUL|nr:hemolysin family protein [Nonlabens ulvanivorans]KEZ92015.1 hemolysin [Nonlabens ulvanivorans]PRX14843.1 CBS domain containing-hemolysin-like protein [Nonlabens ulvanivorans]WOI22791.1 hemolysin family protein [Nonlabens ulvanivorans]GAK99216.1 magnesium and cobalt efflux protein CorC [Nonlabens ulvanivorans]GAL75175.1 magnesium and cobalt efflux protein CorC [Nonlabens ulvanivorans]
MLTAVLIIFTMLVLSAFFSGMEIAYVSSNKIHIELEKRQEDFIGRVLRNLTAHPSKFIISMLIGNSIALVVYGLYMGDLVTEELIIPHLELTESLQLVVQTIISTLVILLTAEFLPKVFFQIYSNELLKFFALPAYIFYLLFTPISWICIKISDFFLRIFFKSNGDNIQLSFSKIELGNYITEQMESAQEQDEVDTEIQIFQNALDFSAVKAREVMVPRTEMISVQQDIDIKELNKKFVNTGLSKILIHHETIDDITGYVHSFDLFKSPDDLNSIVRSVINVPETMLAKDVLNLLMKRRKSIAIVLDEYGGTSGLITVEDIVEELFGEIEDEHDSDTLIDTQISDTEFKFSARLEVDTINENYKLDLPENEQYETLGGLIVFETEGIPTEGDIVTIEQYKFTILETSNNKIDLVELEILDKE